VSMILSPQPIPTPSPSLRTSLPSNARDTKSKHHIVGWDPCTRKQTPKYHHLGMIALDLKLCGSNCHHQTQVMGWL
jgi:hypothetical protein